MNIVVINSLYPPYHRGGAEVVVQTIVDELKTEHSVHVITLQPWKGFSSMKIVTDLQDGVTVHRFYPFNIFSFINIERYPFLIRAIWHLLDCINIHSYIAVRRLLKQLQPDLIVSHNVKGLGYPVLRAMRHTRAHTIHTVHDVQMIEPSGLIMWGKDRVLTTPSFLQRITIALSRWIAASPDRVVFPSRFLKELYQRYGFFKDSQCEVIPNPVSDGFLRGTMQEKFIHTPCRFLMLGQVGEHKGVRIAIEALKAVPDLACILSIVGDGALVGYVKEQTSNDSRIQYKGRLNRMQVQEIIQESDYTLVPSLCYENSPMAIYESMANGTPVIASRIGGVAELVDDVRGYTVTPGSIEELSKTLVKAAGNKSYKEYSQASREKVSRSGVSHYVRALLHSTE